jgi:hypothetical protein
MYGRGFGCASGRGLTRLRLVFGCGRISPTYAESRRMFGASVVASTEGAQPGPAVGCGLVELRR